MRPLVARQFVDVFTNPGHPKSPRNSPTRELVVVRQSRGEVGGSGALVAASSVRATFADSGYTGKELEFEKFFDKGSRKSMHLSLELERSAYEARPRNEATGEVLPTTPRPPNLGAMEARAAARGGAAPRSVELGLAAPVHSTFADTGKTQKQLEADMWFDGGTRRSMHVDLTLASEAYEERPRAPNGQVGWADARSSSLCAPPRAPRFSGTRWR